jgi:hypothetical protein
VLSFLFSSVQGRVCRKGRLRSHRFVIVVGRVRRRRRLFVRSFVHARRGALANSSRGCYSLFSLSLGLAQPGVRAFAFFAAGRRPSCTQQPRHGHWFSRRGGVLASTALVAVGIVGALILGFTSPLVTVTPMCLPLINKLKLIL